MAVAVPGALALAVALAVAVAVSVAVAGALALAVAGAVAVTMAVPGALALAVAGAMAGAVAGAAAAAAVTAMAMAMAGAVAVAVAIVWALVTVNFFLLERCSVMSTTYVIVRTFSAGVFAGYLESRNGREVVLTNARRLWYWAGAASLSEMAMSGTKLPAECKFPVAVDRVLLLEAIEILDCTEAARTSIEGVPVWTA